MDVDSPASRTALGAARHRAVHQLLEAGSILHDPLAVRVTGDDPDDLVARARERGDHRMRWFVCARSRYAEQVLAEAVAVGVDQLVVLGAARHRAVHQLLEAGSILHDPLAVRVTGDDPDDLLARARERGDHRMRWFVCVRSRYAEQVLAAAVGFGVDQLVVLGAGLDTFAYRNPHAGLRVVEVDHPATRAWKLERLAAAGIAVPNDVVHAAVDFERQDLIEVLRSVGLDLERPTLFWWLGVTPYLTGPAVEATLRHLGSLASSAVVLDHATPMDDAADSAALMRRRREAVARLGEPWVSAYAYPELAELVLRSGFTDVRPEAEGATIRRCLGLPPADEPRPSHLLLATRGWPGVMGQPRS